MQEINAEQWDAASGGWLVVVLNAAIGWAVSRSLDGISDAIGSFAASGDAPDYSRTTVMGDMY